MTVLSDRAPARRRRRFAPLALPALLLGLALCGAGYLAAAVLLVRATLAGVAP